MNNPLKFTAEQMLGLEKARGNGDLLVPVAAWNQYIEGNSAISDSDRPASQLYEGYVITDREWFVDIVRSLRNMYIETKLLPSYEGGIWLTTKLEPKKKMKSIDIFDTGRRQGGSFRSRG